MQLFLLILTVFLAATACVLALKNQRSHNKEDWQRILRSQMQENREELNRNIQ